MHTQLMLSISKFAIIMSSAGHVQEEERRQQTVFF